MMELERRRPYAAAANILAVVNRARSRNLPDAIDNDFLRIAGVPEAVYGRVVNALQFLDLIEPDRSPSTRLRAMVSAPEVEFREQLAAAIREAYRDDFKNVDPAQDEQPRIIDAFRRYEPRSQTGRMVMLFLGLCREAGMPVKDMPRERQMQRPVNRTNRPQPKSRGRAIGGSAQTSAASPGISPASAILFGFTDDDVANLDESEFDEVWAALGKVARARARARAAQSAAPEPVLDDDSEDE